MLIFYDWSIIIIFYFKIYPKILLIQVKFWEVSILKICQKMYSTFSFFLSLFTVTKIFINLFEAFIKLIFAKRNKKQLFNLK